MSQAGVRPFLVVGAMKSGTTTLHTILDRHPDVAVLGEKESSSFLLPAAATEMAARIGSSTAVAAGEVSTAYMQQPVHDPPVDRVRRELGDARILAILRDPFERAVSHWRHWYQLGREDEAVQVIADPQGMYVAFSSYHRQLEPWITEFGRENVHAVRLESYRNDPLTTTNALWEFLGVRKLSTGESQPIQANVGADRLVARGWQKRVRESGLYRNVLRAGVPTSLRRAALRSGGGASRRVAAPDLPPALRADFLRHVHDDARQLASVYPHLTWDSSADGTVAGEPADDLSKRLETGQ